MNEYRKRLSQCMTEAVMASSGMALLQFEAHKVGDYSLKDEAKAAQAAMEAIQERLKQRLAPQQPRQSALCCLCDLPTDEAFGSLCSNCAADQEG